MKILLEIWGFAEICDHEPIGIEEVFKKTYNFIRIKNKTDFCYIAEFEDKIIISFRGTKNIRGWLSNINVFPLKNDFIISDGSWGKGTICDGFYSGWIWFKSPVAEFIKNSNKKIICTGVSRGGVLAILCARHIAKNVGRSCSCITFGSPAPGNKYCRDEIDNLPINLTRVVNGYDIVPEVPPYILGFRQPGKLKWLHRSFIRKFFMSMRIKDHFYSSYTKSLMSYCKKRNDEEGYEKLQIILENCNI